MSSAAPGRSRTVLLTLVVVLAVVVLALVGFLVFRQPPSGDSSTDAAPTTRTTATSPSPTTDDTTSASPIPTRTTPVVEPGSVTYQLTGSGDVVGLTFRTEKGREVVAATGAPWSTSTTVSGRKVEMTAMVVRGPVTCTILHGDELISSSTSRGGALRCSGKLPH